MSGLKCPDCGHDVGQHRHNGCVVPHISNYGFCDCKTPQEMVIYKAQRAAAIAHLKELGRGYRRFHGKGGKQFAAISLEFRRAILECLDMARAVGILREPKK